MTTSITKLQKALVTAKKSSARAREKAGELMEQALDAALTGGSAWALGLWEGRAQNRKDYELFGVPAPLVVAAGAYAGMLFGVGRGMEQHVRSIGNGALAAHLNGLGRTMGQRWASSGSLTASSAPPSAASITSAINR